MAGRIIGDIFLSASIPSPDRDRRFYDSADIIAIRDAVRALATVVIPNGHLVWGGHPAITPLIRYVMGRMNADVKAHITLYQSEFFRERFPEDNFSFENIALTQAQNDREHSLSLMREQMIKNHAYQAGIFIGGMEGVIDEFDLFIKTHPKALIVPVASTGAAALEIYNRMNVPLDQRLKHDYAYMALFRDLLSIYL